MNNAMCKYCASPILEGDWCGCDEETITFLRAENERLRAALAEFADSLWVTDKTRKTGKNDYKLFAWQHKVTPWEFAQRAQEGSE